MRILGHNAQYHKSGISQIFVESLLCAVFTAACFVLVIWNTTENKRDLGPALVAYIISAGSFNLLSAMSLSSRDVSPAAVILAWVEGLEPHPGEGLSVPEHMRGHPG